MKRGADPYIKDNKGRTAKDLAVVNNCLDCVDLLEDWESTHPHLPPLDHLPFTQECDY